jgi:hypothetical protein
MSARYLTLVSESFMVIVCWAGLCVVFTYGYVEIIVQSSSDVVVVVRETPYSCWLFTSLYFCGRRFLLGIGAGTMPVEELQCVPPGCQWRFCCLWFFWPSSPVLVLVACRYYFSCPCLTGWVVVSDFWMLQNATLVKSSKRWFKCLKSPGNVFSTIFCLLDVAKCDFGEVDKAFLHVVEKLCFDGPTHPHFPGNLFSAFCPPLFISLLDVL